MTREFTFVPLYLEPHQRLGFTRCEVVPGLFVTTVSQPLRRVLDSSKGKVPALSFHPTHAVFVDHEKYIREVRRRIQADGGTPPPTDDPRWPGLPNHLARHAVISLLLLQRFRFVVAGGSYALELTRPGVYRWASWGAAPMEQVSLAVICVLPVLPQATVDPQRLKRIAGLLDRYYRSGVWHMDRLAVALSSFWNGVCTPFMDQAFVSFTTVLEALLSDGGAEVTQKLAERTARLIGKTSTERLAIYNSVRHLYDIRSRIAHGRVHEIRGRLDWGVFHIDAKTAVVSVDDMKELGRIVNRVVLAVLGRPDIMAVIQKRQPEDAATKQLRELFVRETLG